LNNKKPAQQLNWQHLVKLEKYACLTNTHNFEPLAYEMLRPLNSSAAVLLCELSQRLSANNGEVRESALFFISTIVFFAFSISTPF